MSANELCRLSAAELAPRLKSREVSPVEATRATLEQIERVNPALNAFLLVTADLALDQAKQAEAEIGRGEYRGPLHGIPYSLKDLYYTRGIRTTGGSNILGDWVPDHDSAVGERLREAGAVLLGKNHMHEFAFGTTNLSPHYGPARNPWDQTRVTGGSSGGSAVAVATGMSHFSMGSDTGGSIRIPGSFCGVSGIKPTYGRVSKFGALPLAWSMDHAGPLARSAEDLALVLNAIVGPDPRDRSSAEVPVPDFAAALQGAAMGLRVGVIQDYMDDAVTGEIKAGVRQAVQVLDGLGAEVQEVSLAEVAGYLGAATTILHAEAAAYHVRWLTSRKVDYSPAVVERLQVGSLIPAIDYVNAQRARTVLVDRALELMRNYDVLVSPTEPMTACTLEDGARPEIHNTIARHTRMFNLLGFPAMSIPCGFGEGNLPIGLQLVGRPWEEGTILRLAHAYQQATDWHQRWPSIADR